MANKQTLVQAVYLATSGKSRELRSAACCLIGTMPGSGERAQAHRQMVSLLPVRRLRAYTAEQFLESVCRMDDGERWHLRDEPGAIATAARIESETAVVS